MNKAPMISSSPAVVALGSSAPGSSASPQVAMPLAVTTRQWRGLPARFQHARRRRERRGIILIFVVVLLMLLAIMGTAYLASSRADRQGITSNGAIPGSVASPRLEDRSRLDALFTSTQRRVQNEIIEDLFNVSPGTLRDVQADVQRSGTSGATQTRIKNAAARAFTAYRQEQLPAVATGASQDSNRYYENYDAPGRADPFLASLLPDRVEVASTPPTAGPIMWPWISAPLSGELSPGIQTAPFFADPRQLSRNAPATDFGFRGAGARVAVQPDPSITAPIPWNLAVLERHNVLVSAVEMLRSDSINAGLTVETSRTTRVYPGLSIGGAAARMAADADGDGIADSMLSPVVLNPRVNGVDRYLDSANGVVYFVGYRVVDNSSQINVNTALTARGDFDFPAALTALDIRARIVGNTANIPNLGFFRTNVGLTELIRNSLAIYTSTPSPVTAELGRLVDARFPGLGSPNSKDTTPPVAWSIARLSLQTDPVSGAASPVVVRYYEGERNTTAAAIPAVAWMYEFRTFGDLVEQTMARQPESIEKIRTGQSRYIDRGLVSLPVGDSIAFASGGGSLLNLRLTPDVTENVLLFSTRMHAPNFTASNEEPWRWFPPAEWGVWFGWSKDFAPTPGIILNTSAANPPTPIDPTNFDRSQFAIKLLDHSSATARQYAFDPATELNTAYTGTSRTGMTSISLPRSIRPLLTTRSGVTNTVPKREDGGAGAFPAGMPKYGDPTPTDPNRYPAIRIAAATATKEQLWRAYWSVMTQNELSSPTAANMSWVTERKIHTGNVNGTGMGAYLNSQPYEAFMPPDRHPSLTQPLDVTTGFPQGRPPLTQGQTRPWDRLNEKQMAQIRAAVAACNTIDLRDPDNDITAMTVDLGETLERFNGDIFANPPVGPDAVPNAREKLFARVYGTEKQLVISAVVIDDPDGGVGPGATTFVGVEIFNPTDETIDLRGYHLALVQRGTPANTTLDDGLVTVPPTVLDVPTTSLNSALGAETLAPGGFIVAMSAPAAPAGVGLQPAMPAAPTPPSPGAAQPTADPLPTVAPTQVIHLLMPWLIDVQGVAGADKNRELVLLRTRRADGVRYTETPDVETDPNYQRPAFSELAGGRDPTGAGAPDSRATAAAVEALTTLVPVDAVDVRSITYVPAGTRAWYMRNTVPPNKFEPHPYAWKAFYAGRFYPDPTKSESVRTVGTPGSPAETPSPALALRPATYGQKPEPTVAIDRNHWAWRSYPDYEADPADPATAASGEGSLGTYRNPGYTVTPSTSTTNNAASPPAPGQAVATPAPTALRGLVPTPYLAPTIPIQNAKPYTVFDASTGAAAYAPLAGEVDHPPFRFPYATPFARNGDVLNVPFIGSYKIYRVPTTGFNTTGTPGGSAGMVFGPVAGWELYEYVPITMDAVNVAPNALEWSEVRNPTAVGAVPFLPNTSVGRFDPRTNIAPRNDWASDLFDFVTARQPAGEKLQFPDMPNVLIPPALADRYNDPVVPLTDQDGPVVGFDTPLLANPLGPVPPGMLRHPSNYVQWLGYLADRASPPPPTLSRSVDTVTGGPPKDRSNLIAGTININTAPPVVLRMLPLTVNPMDGLLDQAPGLAAVNQQQRLRVGLIEDFLENPTDVPGFRKIGRRVAPRAEPPFGFTSTMQLAEVKQLAADDQVLNAANARTGTYAPVLGSAFTNRSQLMRYGILNPGYRSFAEPPLAPGALDFGVTHLNATRVSNLTSQRSDVFTVYVTVQAWTWVGDSPGKGTPEDRQAAGTRLVGERRGSFIVDRSTITQEAFTPDSLLIFPVDQE